MLYFLPLEHYKVSMVLKIEPFYSEVGRRIKERREKRGLTQEALGKALTPPMSRVSIANIELGNQRILSHSFVQIANELNVELVELLPIKELPLSGNALDITDEIVFKLGITKIKAKKLADKVKKAKDKLP